MDRLVALEGTMNFRDLGGYETTDGRTVRWGEVFRADGLNRLTPADHAELERRGIRVAYDLRRPREVEAAPDVLPDGIERVWLPMADDGAVDQPELMDLLLSGEITEVKAEFMAEVYAEILRDHASVFGRLFEGLADESRRPAVFHCVAGKDRTGMAAALLLSVLGVPESTILDDYLLTNEYRSQRRVVELRPQLESAGIDVDMVLPLLTAPREVMEFCLRHIDDTYRSPEHYLLDHCAVSPDVIGGLRDQLVEAAPDSPSAT